MKKQILKNYIGVYAFPVFLLVTSVFVPVFAQETLSGGYQFGPGLTQTVNDEVNLRVPARTNVGIIVGLQRNLTNEAGVPITNDVNVIIEIFRPGSNTPAMSQTASATVVQAGLQIPSISIPGLFTDQKGCPSVWKVRIKAANGRTPPVRIFGTVTFAFVKPGKINLGIEGGSFDLASGANSTKTLSGHELTELKRELIAGTGRFEIKAKFHTDPLDVLKFNTYFQIRVELLKPDGTLAASQTGFSQHAPADKTPKVNFSYIATAADAALTGAWRLRVTNLTGNPKITGFDIERGLDLLSPSFNSVFQAQCSEPVTVQ